MRYRDIPLVWKIGVLGLYFALLALWIISWTGFVNWLPDYVAAYLGYFLGGMSAGYLLGARFR